MASNSEMLRFLGLFLFTFVAVHAKQKSNLVELTEESWRDMLEGEWLVKFYAPWCPACRGMSSVWEGVASWSEDLDIKVAKIDVTENPGLSGRFLVTSLPTVYHVNDGEFRVYRGPRVENDIISFVDDKKWEQVEPVAWYFSPSAMHMSGLAMFFKASMGIRDLHDQMTTQYGIPVWGSYCIFALVTILFGLLLGLLIVFLCDCMLPNHPPEPSYISTRYQAAGGPGPIDDDKDSDILVDDLPVKEAVPKQSPKPSKSPRKVKKDSSESTESGATPANDSEESGSQDEGLEVKEEQSQEEQSQEEQSQEEKSQEEEGPAEAQGASGGDVPRPKSARRRKLKATSD